MKVNLKNLNKVITISTMFILFSVFVTSCQKEELIKKQSPSISSNDPESELIDGWITTEKPVFNKKTKRNKASQRVLWVLGAGGQIYRSYDDGVSWTEPSPSSAAKQISAGDGGLWGISPDDRIWRWNGTTWIQPNSSARAVQISCMSDGEAWVVTSAGNVYFTTNSGVSYYPADISSTGPLQEVSVGNYNNVYGVTDDEHLVRYNYYTNKFELVGAVTEFIEAGSTVDFLYAVGANNRLFYSTNGGANWTEPNVNNVVYDMATITNSTVFAIGASGRIFKSTNYGTTWIEPNLSATATQITEGIEYN